MRERKTKFYKLIKEDEHGNNCIAVSISYNIGGYNLFTCKQEKRGWYFSITPCCRKEDGKVKTIDFTSCKILIQECKRNSQKQFENALKFMEENQKELLNKWFSGKLITNWKEI